TITRKPQGLLQPLPVPAGPWQDISYDFITGLPESEEKNAILNVVDRCTKQAHFIPTTENVNASATADLFLAHVWKLHGLPQRTVSYPGQVFNSKFMPRLY